MKLNMTSGKFILTAAFLLICQALFAQESGYYFEYVDGKPKFFQCLVWEKEESALSYEVSIFVDEDGYQEYLKEITEDAMLLVSLPAGKYRFGVTPIDLLGARGQMSEWIEFKVFPAHQPGLTSFSPGIFYLDQDSDRVLNVTGNNFLTESEIYLQNAQNAEDILYPEKVIIIDSRKATLYFEDLDLQPGSYGIYVKNPGGLDTRISGFNIGYRKLLDFFIKVAYAPAFPVFGDLKKEGTFIYPLGASLSLDMISSIRGDFNAGMQVASTINFFGLPPKTETPQFITSLDVSFALQRRFNRGRMAFTFRAGPGIVFVNGINNMDGLIIQLNAGVDYLVRLYGLLFLETGVEYSNHFMSSTSGIIKPKIGLVLKI